MFEATIVILILSIYLDHYATIGGLVVGCQDFPLPQSKIGGRIALHWRAASSFPPFLSPSLCCPFFGYCRYLLPVSGQWLHHIKFRRERL